MTSCPINVWVSSTNWEQLKTIFDYNDMQFATKIISNGYPCGVDTWLTFSISAIQNTCKWKFKNLHVNFLNHNKNICIASIAQYEHYVFVENTRCNQEERMNTKKKKKIGQNWQTLIGAINWIQHGLQHAFIIKVENFHDLTWNTNFPIYQACRG
jgi:hypothetical protein